MIFNQPINSEGGYSYNARFYTDAVYESHFHKNLELIMVLKGSLSCTVDKRDYVLYEGDAGLCLPYSIHSFTPAENSEFWIIVFSDDYVRMFSKEIFGKSADGFAFRPCPEAWDYAISRMVKNPSPTVYTLKSALYGIVDDFLKSVTLSDRGVGARGIPEIVSYIEKHHQSALTLSELATELGYDYNYTSRYFHKMFGMSFTELLNVYRLATAVRLIEDTEAPITDIAYESGFSSIRNFNAVFKSKMGVTPSVYRRDRGRANENTSVVLKSEQ